ncbi:hypothetical protein FN976_16460 [Caenimonas sedimenti]|uniref:Uncharacterized protein n=1 Tax=Caenimonas sedimenti TaxID=2596921 RepID=A0A562ZNK1_9BURK|nr:hypothetical protein [Caenimonas sedimenti]TWO69941.1 hypothetical protein FN976_16460 [Caenimonas sedimenti]
MNRVGVRVVACVLVALQMVACATWRAHPPAFALHRQWMADPPGVETSAIRTATALAGAAGSPSRLLAATAGLAGWRPLPQSFPATARPAWVAACGAPPWPAGAFATAVDEVLSAIDAAEHSRRAALGNLPPGLDAQILMPQVAARPPAQPSVPDYRAALGRIDPGPLLAGMLRLVAAVEALDAVLSIPIQVPAVRWQCDTTLGGLLIDTTGADNVHLLANPLLVIDVGGNDQYVFERRDTHNRISVLLDRGGNDRYQATAPGSDPSAGVLGYGVLWDAGGDDRYEAGDFAQAAALFGIALLHDTAGEDIYTARGFSQAFAIAGLAILHDRSGGDRYSAATHAQASGGPAGVALLLDAAGNDRYALVNEPLVLPSAQLPDRNASMGQGAGRGLAMPAHAQAVPGGLGLLLDLSGDDHYSGQVFAQGVGYLGGGGLLFDGGGSDSFDAAWYSLGAAAHQAVGVLVKRGAGNDRYRSTHATALAAAHDGSVAVFADDGGDDRYALGEFGLGGESDGGRAVFRDGGGTDVYEVRGPCAGEAVTAARTGSSRTGPPAPCRR